MARVLESPHQAGDEARLLIIILEKNNERNLPDTGTPSSRPWLRRNVRDIDVSEARCFGICPTFVLSCSNGSDTLTEVSYTCWNTSDFLRTTGGEVGSRATTVAKDVAPFFVNFTRKMS